MGAAAQYVHVCNNTAQLYEFAPAPGHGRLDFPPGWSRVPAAAVDRITGGFDRKGKAKGGVAARYFNEPIEVEPGKFRPVLHLGRPAQGETVHKIDVLPGVRSHFRMTRVREQEKTIEELKMQIAGLAAQVSGSAVAAKPEQSVDVTALEPDQVKAAIAGLSLTEVKAALADELTGPNRKPVVGLLTRRVKKLSKG